MERLTPVLRISLGLALLTCSIIVLLDLLGLVPEPRDAALEARIQLCETLAAQTTPAIAKDDFASIRSVLLVAVRRNDDVLSAGLRAANGRLLVSAGSHRERWDPDHEARSTATHVQIPMFKGATRWATLEVRFRGITTIGATGLLGALWQRPLIRLVMLVGVLGFATYLVYLRRTLRHLDPSAVIPARVQAALDVMAEGVLLLDQEERIVLANQAFAARLGRTPKSLLGVKASTLGWQAPGPGASLPEFPWWDANREARTSTQTSLCFEETPGNKRIFAVHVSPVLDGWGKPKGAIATFDDVTELEQKTAALEKAMTELEKSQGEIRLQNEELETLAKRDPLTGIANRRAFMEWFELQFASTKREGRVLSCVMADIDHFKRINDAHGHATGDEVIRRLAELLATAVRSSDAACRYGGEEFCIVLTGVKSEAATQVAERLREKMRSPGFARVPFTVSFGVASTASGASTLAELLEQSDRALYASKEAGRDRVTRWEDIAD
ncbi:MAG: sensor domain-containing diguanylate cyclase [Deltaproteobacteria bacterium]|nr:sensor domain-containing diguanylate cyclase [Deltaproteobacteria bacterium]